MLEKVWDISSKEIQSSLSWNLSTKTLFILDRGDVKWYNEEGYWEVTLGGEEIMELTADILAPPDWSQRSKCQSILVEYPTLVFADCHVHGELVFTDRHVHQVGIVIRTGLNDAQIPAVLLWNSVLWSRCLQSESSLKHPVSSPILRGCLWVVQFAEALL